jgi:AraC-like DNA-binding protein
VDTVGGLLDGPRARDAFLLRSLLRPPWSMRIADEAPLTLVAVTEGGAHLRLADGPPTALAAGDVAVLRGPEPYVVADHPDTPVQVVIHPGQVCEAVLPDVRPMRELGVRTWGNADPAGGTTRTELLTGTYHLPGETSRRLLRTLPPLAVVRAADRRHGALLTQLADEITRDEPGQDAVLDRLLDLVLITTLRAWFARPGGHPPGWYAAHGDPVVGPALRLLHHRPADPWTLTSLAAEVGVSRATLARRFHEMVGEPPMSFLTEWRLTLAADLLREPGATVASVARRVGYAGPYALSTAFKRVRGISPREHRDRTRAEPVEQPVPG